MLRCGRILFWIFLLQLSIASWAQNDNPVIGARAAALAGAAVTIADGWALSNNVAGIGKLEEPHLGVWAENRFLIKGFNAVAVQGVMPFGKFGVGGADLYRFGDHLYNEQRVGLGYAYRLGQVSLGAKADLLQVAIQGLGSRRTVAFSVGGHSEIVPHLVVAAHLYNLNQARLARTEDERVPTVMKAGLSYRPLDTLMLNLETEKQLDLPADFKAGLEYRLLDKLALRTGFSSLAQSLTFGLGFRAQVFEVDYALGTRTALGVSNHLSLAYRFRG